MSMKETKLNSVSELPNSAAEPSTAATAENFFGSPAAPSPSMDLASSALADLGKGDFPTSPSSAAGFSVHPSDSINAAGLLMLMKLAAPPLAKRARIPKGKESPDLSSTGAVRKKKSKHAGKDSRNPNSCETHKRRHLKCGDDCVERKRRELEAQQLMSLASSFSSVHQPLPLPFVLPAEPQPLSLVLPPAASSLAQQVSLSAPAHGAAGAFSQASAAAAADLAQAQAPRSQPGLPAPLPLAPPSVSPAPSSSTSPSMVGTPAPVPPSGLSNPFRRLLPQQQQSQQLPQPPQQQLYQQHQQLYQPQQLYQQQLYQQQLSQHYQQQLAQHQRP
eukprot:TRINITY_DN31881_c0_g1_i1.p1 TRINITY_DN31881_c0_g1~~TRINITY_DN31881_c0_g1_i1.p1  ORF type:complete len:350 (-),score=67.96 TRINITY_DN31881_c0_g1_i1:296-1291(-)